MRKNKILLSFFALFCLTGCDIIPFFKTKVSEITINRNSVNLEYDEKIKIEAIVYPEDANNKELSWSSSDDKIAKVENGYITGVGSGDAVITCSATDGSGISKTIEVNVVPIKPTEMNYTFQSVLENNFTRGYCANSNYDLNLLVIPIWLNDSSNFIADSKKESVRQDIETAFFGTNEETGWRSVKTYYEEESFEKIEINGFVTDWYSANNDVSYYGKKSGRICTLRTSAVEWAKEYYTDIDWTEYDNDKDGFFDGIAMVFAAPDHYSYTENGYGDYNQLWSWVISTQTDREPNIDSPAPANYIWATYDSLYESGDSAIKHTGKSPYGRAFAGMEIDSRTLIHEVGHILGALDLYDVNSVNGVAGAYSMQEISSGMHDPFTLMTFGWIAPYIPKKSIDLTLKPFSTSGETILLSPEFNDINSPFDEYFLLQYYTPTGLYEQDANKYGFVPKNEKGIMVFHVDARLVACTDQNNLNENNITYWPENDGEKVNFICSNNTFNGNNASNCSCLGSDYYDYNLVQLISNNVTSTINRPYVALEGNELFKEGSAFDMDTFKTQFVNPGKLNSNKDLGWEFSVGEATSEGIKISLTKLD